MVGVNDSLLARPIFSISTEHCLYFPLPCQRSHQRIVEAFLTSDRRTNPCTPSTGYLGFETYGCALWPNRNTESCAMDVHVRKLSILKSPFPRKNDCIIARTHFHFWKKSRFDLTIHFHTSHHGFSSKCTIGMHSMVQRTR